MTLKGPHMPSLKLGTLPIKQQQTFAHHTDVLKPTCRVLEATLEEIRCRIISGIIISSYHIICAGAVLLTASDAPTINGLFMMFVIVQAIYGIGVGGEYPVVRTSSFIKISLYTMVASG